MAEKVHFLEIYPRARVGLCLPKGLAIRTPAADFDQNLHDIPRNPREWEAFVAELEAKLHSETDPGARLECLEYRGMALRTLRRLPEAESALLEALTLAKSTAKHNRVIQNLARLAHVHQWQGEFRKAHGLYREIKALSKENPVSSGLTASLHQHQGKVFFDQGLLGAAQAEFAVALKMREVFGLPEDQTESSREALAETRRRRNHPNDRFLRRAFGNDAPGIHEAHMKSIQELCAKDHSPEEIRAWGHRPYNESQRLWGIRNEWVWVVEEAGSIEGYAHLRVSEKNGITSGYVFGFYLTPKAIGRSLGHSLFATLHEVLVSQDASYVTLDSTITAKAFYEKRGFVAEGPEKTVEIAGTPVRCYPMKLTLES
jgi:tetratricopeptide (TPR) repeat protein